MARTVISRSGVLTTDVREINVFWDTRSGTLEENETASVSTARSSSDLMISKFVSVTSMITSVMWDIKERSMVVRVFRLDL